jgi:hypothetical protein
MTTIDAGGLIILDPSDERLLDFTWDGVLESGVAIDESTWTITAIKQSGVTALTTDNETILGSESYRVTQARFLATTATVGDRYWVSNEIVTDETPAQTIEQRFKVLIQNQ